MAEIVGIARDGVNMLTTWDGHRYYEVRLLVKGPDINCLPAAGAPFDFTEICTDIHALHFITQEIHWIPETKFAIATVTYSTWDPTIRGIVQFSDLLPLVIIV